MRNLIPILGLLAWFFLVKTCVVDPSQSQCCGAVDSTAKTSKAAVAAASAKKQVSDPLLFNWSKCNPITNERFAAYRDSIIELAGKSKRLQIWGQHFKGEARTQECPGIDLGMARAKRIKELFAQHIDPARIQLGSKLVKNPKASQKTSAFRSAYFDWVVDNGSVKEIDDKALIYFKYNSNKKISDVNIDNYLHDVAKRVKKSGERIVLTGHTDSDGGAAANMRLGKRRAEAIKNILVSKGVDASKISTQSKGETAPIASNATAEGRQKNRRTELQIIK